MPGTPLARALSSATFREVIVRARPFASITTTCTLPSLASLRRKDASASSIVFRFIIAKSSVVEGRRPYAAWKFNACACRRSVAARRSSSSLARSLRALRPAFAKYPGNDRMHSSHDVTPVSVHHRARHATWTYDIDPLHLHGEQNGGSSMRHIRHSAPSGASGTTATAAGIASSSRSFSPAASSSSSRVATSGSFRASLRRVDEARFRSSAGGASLPRARAGAGAFAGVASATGGSRASTVPGGDAGSRA
mmetsp:Transcript_2492/g.7956  ORF Transcript_2492/g.7956 Transcript_2492/m.7956 type:complete len:251 (-) Transcript_2492:39-791(-)|eukprot:31075-Pelagococcus_subviridis.AAC.3